MGISPQRIEDLKDWSITCKLLDAAYTASYVASAKVAAVTCTLAVFGYGICYLAAQQHWLYYEKPLEKLELIVGTRR